MDNKPVPQPGDVSSGTQPVTPPAPQYQDQHPSQSLTQTYAQPAAQVQAPVPPSPQPLSHEPPAGVPAVTADNRAPASIAVPTTGSSANAWIAIVATLVIIGSLGAGLWFVGKNAFGGLQQKASELTSGNSAADLPAPKVYPTSDGSTDCYTMRLVAGSKAEALDNCSLRISFGTEQYDRMNVRTLIGQHQSLESAVSRWKGVMKDANMTIESETAVKSGPYDAKRLVYVHKTLKARRMALLVYTGPKYKVDNYNPDGFEIDGDYDSPAQQQAVDTMLASLQWKQP